MHLMQETSLTWTLNGQIQAPLLCSPAEDKALLRGYLLTEGLVSSNAAIHEIRSDFSRSPMFHVSADIASPSGPLVCTRPLRISSAQSLDLLHALDDVPRDFGEHAALIRDGKSQVSASDISRHHALDKAVGKALDSGMDLSGSILCISARVTLEIIRKAARTGIPIVCTRKAVGTLAAGFARDAGCAIVCASSPLEIYGTRWRVETS